jgi:hypothetical protein
MDERLIKKIRKAPGIALITLGLLAACAPAATQTIEVHPSSPTEAINNSKPDSTISSSPSLTPTDEIDFGDFVFVPLLPYDGIRPIYEPDFVEAPDSPLNDDELVMGVAIQGESKAYPVSVLRFREMVDDELGGLPILVTW